MVGRGIEILSYLLRLTLMFTLSAISLSTSGDIRVRSRPAVKRRLGHDTRSHVRREVEVYFRRFPRYSFDRVPSKRPISQARMAPSRVLVAARRRMPTDRRQRHRPLVARRAALPKTTAELPPKLTCKSRAPNNFRMAFIGTRIFYSESPVHRPPRGDVA